MKQLALSQFEHPGWVAFALLLFFVPFVGFAVKIFLAKTEDIDQVSRLPLGEE